MTGPNAPRSTFRTEADRPFFVVRGVYAREHTMNDATMRSPSKRDVEADEPEPDPQLREVTPETPEADAIQQRETAFPDNVDDELETLPADASEADALEQSRVVPVDDSHDV
jgi:hypothetical protein